MPPPFSRLRFQAALFAGLLLLLINIKTVALIGIDGYREWISPALGPQCGYARERHAETCSAYARRVIAEKGFFRGAILSQERFRACGNLAKERLPWNTARR